jgi:hypothetical protein
MDGSNWIQLVTAPAAREDHAARAVEREGGFVHLELDDARRRGPRSKQEHPAGARGGRRQGVAAQVDI